MVRNFLIENEETPWDAMKFMTGMINYGGRVTDDKDIRLIKSILWRFMNKGALETGYAFSDSGTYKSIAAGNHEDYVKYINDLPMNPHPEAFGLHENAEITTNQTATRNLRRRNAVP